MPQLPPPLGQPDPYPYQNSRQGPATATQVNPAFNGLNWDPWRAGAGILASRRDEPRVHQGAQLPPPNTVQARRYADVQQRLLESASVPHRFVHLVSTINAGLFAPPPTAAEYLRELKLLQLAYASVTHLHHRLQQRQQRGLNILVCGARGGFVPLALAIFSGQDDRITVLDPARQALIAARANIQRDGKDLFLQRMSLFPGNLSMLSSGFDLIVVNNDSAGRRSGRLLHQLKQKLVTRGLIVLQQGKGNNNNTFRLLELEPDRRFSTVTEIENGL